MASISRVPSTGGPEPLPRSRKKDNLAVASHFSLPAKATHSAKSKEAEKAVRKNMTSQFTKGIQAKGMETPAITLAARMFINVIQEPKK